MTAHHRSRLAFLLVLLLSLATSTSGLKGKSLLRERSLKSSKSSKKNGPTRRDCKLKTKQEKIAYECKSKGEDVHDKIKYQVESKGGNLKIKVEYHQHDHSQDEENENVKTKYEIDFDKVVEYRKAEEEEEEEEEKAPVLELDSEDIALTRQRDTTGDAVDTVDTTTETSQKNKEKDPSTQAFDWERDDILQEYALENWDEMSEIDDDGTVIHFSVASDIATFFFTISREDLENVTVNEMKIDFELKDFPWEAEDSYVALLSSITSEQKVKVRDDDNSKKGRRHEKVEISFDDATEKMKSSPFGEYTWKSEAEARELIEGNETAATNRVANSTSMAGNETDSTTGNETAATKRVVKTIQVIATSPSDSDNQIAFSFVGKAARGSSNIYWDPSAGVGYGSSASSKWVELSLAVAAASSLLLLLG